MNRKTVSRYFTLCCAIGLLLNAPCYGSELSAKKRQYQQLSTKIQHAQHTLSRAQQKKTTLQAQLASQEKKIGSLITQKSWLNSKIKRNNTAIIELSQQVDHLNSQINQAQQVLAKQVQARYQIDLYQPLKWLLIPGSKETLDQTLTYYMYLMKVQQESIHSINMTTSQLNHKKASLADLIKQDKDMHHKLAVKQSVLESVQKKQQQIINQLDLSIRSKSEKLKEFRHNQKELSRIIHVLTKQDRIAQNKPFASRRHHLPRPVSVKVNAIKPIHQGLAFLAPAGTTVSAIHPGKILFSDWLKGYGLLLIIDHGNGYLTLYAHNQTLTKRKGDWVEGGEKIAEIGHSGGLRENGLYFELRHNGKAISPINWLS